MIETDNSNCSVCVANGTGCTILTNCPTEILQRITDTKRKFIYKKGYDIFREGNSGKGIYLISAGKVMLYKTDSNGKNLILRFLKKGDAIGCRNRQHGFLQSISARVIEDANVCYLTYNHFQQIMCDSPELIFSLLLSMEKEIEMLEDKSFQLANFNVAQKVTSTLLNLLEVYGFGESNQLDTKLSREDIAAVTGTTKEQVSKELRCLQAKGYIKLKAKHIGIIDEQALRRLVSK